MKILVTGSAGFIAKNLLFRLAELKGYEALCFTREHSIEDLEVKVNQADAIIHLAGVNRPLDPTEFIDGNVNLTKILCSFIAKSGRKVPLIIASSIQAEYTNPYGKSKYAAEVIVRQLSEDTGNPVAIYRLPNVFGKWCKPNYNSVVATFCHNIANNIPIQINDPAVNLNLAYVDDVVSEFLSVIHKIPEGFRVQSFYPTYSIRLEDLATQIMAFENSRDSLILQRVGVGLVRALYATYVSYLPPKKFAYKIPKHVDERGIFVEMFKTQDSGQLSFFTALPGVVRGGHYHHTKTEKFLVVKGEALFRFRHLLTDEKNEIYTTADNPKIVETVPGWTHDVKNVGQSELIVMLWANEIFDPKQPDTISSKV